MLTKGKNRDKQLELPKFSDLKVKWTNKIYVRLDRYNIYFKYCYIYSCTHYYISLKTVNSNLGSTTCYFCNKYRPYISIKNFFIYIQINLIKCSRYRITNFSEKPVFTRIIKAWTKCILKYKRFLKFQLVFLIKNVEETLMKKYIIQKLWLYPRQEVQKVTQNLPQVQVKNSKYGVS